MRREVANSSSIVVGDISTVGGALDLADQVSALGPVDAVIHNAGVGYGGSLRPAADGLPDIFSVNVLAPYIPTPGSAVRNGWSIRSSSMHRVSPNLRRRPVGTRRWNGSLAYSESKFLVTPLRLPLRGSGPRCAPMWSIRAGFPHAWEVVVLRTISEKAALPRWLLPLRASRLSPGSRGSTFTTWRCSSLTGIPGTHPCRISCWTSARASQA